MANTEKIPYLNVMLPGASKFGNPSSPYASVPADDGTSGRRYTTRQVQWSGLNRGVYIDTGTLTDVSGMTMKALPYLESDNVFADKYSYEGKRIINLTGIGDALIVVYNDGSAVKMDVFSPADSPVPTAAGVIKSNAAGDYTYRSIVQFNVYKTPTDPIAGEFDRKVLIFPDKLSMGYVTEVSGNIEFASLGDTYPDIKLAAVQDSRLFGVDDARIYASGANDYANWDLDTATDYSSAHAWCSPTQADSRADGSFTAITSYGGHIVAFKEDFTHELYNNKNPFYLQELFGFGAIDQRTVHEVGGRLLFVSQTGVISYGGGSPQIIDSELCIDSYERAVCGAHQGIYYLSVQDNDGFVTTYTYNTENGAWSIFDTGAVLPDGYCSVGGRLYAAVDGQVLALDDGAYGEWFFDTDIKTGGTLDVKSLTRLLVLASMAPNSSFNISLLGEDGAEERLYSYENGAVGDAMRCVRLAANNNMRHCHRLRIYGRGLVRVHNMELVYRTGGKLYGDTT